MSGLWIWLGAALLYVAFRAWYDSWRGPLTTAEIEEGLKRIAGTPSGELNDLATLRDFLERDDGREFLMLNLVRLNPLPAPHPLTGELTPAPRLLREYIRAFVPVLLRTGGHPALQALKVGGYLDAWNVEPDPGWSFMGWMRYRSRRDLLRLVTDPRFQAAHPFKAAAIPVTFSFPTQPQVALYLGPRLWVGLVLALGAALGHLAWLALA